MGFNRGQGMLSRFRRSFSKNATSKAEAKDAATDPHTRLRSAIREIEKAVDDLSQSYAAAAGRRIEAERHIQNLTAHIVKLDEKARLALGQNREDLASAIITQQIGYEKELADWNDALGNANVETEQLRTEVASMKMRKLDLAEQLLRDIQAEQQVAANAASDLERDMLDQRVTGAIAAYDDAIAPAALVGDDLVGDDMAQDDQSITPTTMLNDEVQARMAMLRQESSGAEPTM